jgi:hypothetical protein
LCVSPALNGEARIIIGEARVIVGEARDAERMEIVGHMAVGFLTP